MVVNGSICLLVQNLAGPEEEPLSRFDCDPNKTPITTPVSGPYKLDDRIDLRVGECNWEFIMHLF